MHLSQRQSRQCKSDTQWYMCTSNGFNGCCSVDPCDLAACPDKVLISKSPAPLTTIVLSIHGLASTSTIDSNPPSSSRSTSASTSSSRSTTSSSPASRATSGTTTVLTRTRTRDSSKSTSTSTPASALAANPTALESPQAISSPSDNETPIIVGTVCGIVALAIISVILWTILRRRNSNLRKSTFSATSSFSLGKEPFISTEQDHLKPNDVLAQVGGYYKKFKAIQTRSISGQSKGSAFSHNTLKSTPRGRQPIPQNEPEEDRPIPDVEKASIKPPPVSEHPVFHQLPGQSAENPAYIPGQPIVSPQMSLTASFLSKHPSLVNESPSMRSASTPPISTPSLLHGESHPAHGLTRSSPKPRRPLHSRSASNVLQNALSTLPSQQRDRKNTISRTHSIHSPNNPPFRPAYSPPPMKSLNSPALQPMVSPPMSNFSLTPLSNGPHSMRSHSSMPILSPASAVSFMSPIPGRSELLAELPSHSYSPLVPHELSGNDVSWRQITRGNSQMSTYSIPIGLGSSPASSHWPLESVLERSTRGRSATEPARGSAPLSAPKIEWKFRRDITPPQSASYASFASRTRHLTHSSTNSKSPKQPLAQFSAQSTPDNSPRKSVTTEKFCSSSVDAGEDISEAQYEVIPLSVSPQIISTGRPKMRSSTGTLGKGKEHAMAWQNYRAGSSPSSTVGSASPSDQERHIIRESPEVESPVFRRAPDITRFMNACAGYIPASSLRANANLTGSGSGSANREGEEMVTPAGLKREHAFRDMDREDIERAKRAGILKGVDLEIEKDILPVTSKKRQEKDRWSGSTIGDASPPIHLGERARDQLVHQAEDDDDTDAGLGDATPLNQLYRNSWVDRGEIWSAKP